MSNEESVFKDNVVEEYPDYLRDESRRGGCAESISFPESEPDVIDHLAEAREKGLMVTLQGARTGITGGAVPEGDHILNLSRMTRALGLRYDEAADQYHLTLQPGVLLEDLTAMSRRKEFETDEWSDESLVALDRFRSADRYWFPPDLTETTASVGGLISNNGSGARSFCYGATRRHVSRLRVVLMDGEVIEVRRGDHRAKGRHINLVTERGRVLAGELPSYTMPEVKNAAGYYAADDMDLVDLFVGAEGTLGVVTEMDLVLSRAPVAVWGVTAFLPDEESALSFVRGAREGDPRPGAIEFLDSHALELLRGLRERGGAFDHIPELRADWHSAVYVEYHAADDDAAEAAVAGMSEVLEACGGDMDKTWLAVGEREIERFKSVRHSVPEGINMRIDERRKQEPRLTKLGTDLAVPDDRLEDVVTLYHRGLDETGLDFAMFGHIGNNHLHVNIIPRDMGEYERGKALYLQWAREVVAMGGTVSAEHGIGKLKRNMLEIMFGADGIDQMRAVKRLFDPEGRLNRGNLFTWETE